MTVEKNITKSLQLIKEASLLLARSHKQMESDEWSEDAYVVMNLARCKLFDASSAIEDVPKEPDLRV